MPLTQPTENERAAWLLQHHGFQVLVLTEDDCVVISERVSSREDAGAMMAAALDVERDPSLTLGPDSIQIPLDRLISTKLRPARDLLDLETDTEIHRVGGWKSPALVVGGRN